MAYDEGLAERLAEGMAGQPGLIETRMFGGFGYLLNGNMCVGIHKDTLIIRVGLERAAQILSKPHVRPMDLTGRVMKGWAMVEPEAMSEDAELLRYCQYALDFVKTLPAK